MVTFIIMRPVGSARISEINPTFCNGLVCCCRKLNLGIRAVISDSILFFYFYKVLHKQEQLVLIYKHQSCLESLDIILPTFKPNHLQAIVLFHSGQWFCCLETKIFSDNINNVILNYT